MNEHQTYIREELEEIRIRLGAGVLRPLSETIQMIRQNCQDPAGASFAGRLEVHRKRIESAEKKLESAIRVLS